MRAALLGLLLAISQIGATAYSESRVYSPSTTPTGGGGADTIGNPDPNIFKLPEDSLAEPKPEPKTDPSQHPMADQPTWNSAQPAQWEAKCKQYKDQGDMVAYRTCWEKAKQDDAAGVEESFDRTSGGRSSANLGVP